MNAQNWTSRYRDFTYLTRQIDSRERHSTSVGGIANFLQLKYLFGLFSAFGVFGIARAWILTRFHTNAIRLDGATGILARAEYFLARTGKLLINQFNLGNILVFLRIQVMFY